MWAIFSKIKVCHFYLMHKSNIFLIIPHLYFGFFVVYLKINLFLYWHEINSREIFLEFHLRAKLHWALSIGVNSTMKSWYTLDYKQFKMYFWWHRATYKAMFNYQHAKKHHNLFLLFKCKQNQCNTSLSLLVDFINACTYQ